MPTTIFCASTEDENRTYRLAQGEMTGTPISNAPALIARAQRLADYRDMDRAALTIDGDSITITHPAFTLFAYLAN